MIDKQLGIPIYIQIQTEIKQKIEAGVWQVGTAIPAERQLAEMFHVSRMTVRQAIQGLVDDNILQRRVGAGTFIAEKKLTERLEAVTSFTNLMLQEGKKPSTRIVSYGIRPASTQEQEALGIPEKSNVMKVERIRYGDMVPILYEVAAIPEYIASLLTKEDIMNSLYEAVETKIGKQIGEAEQTMEASLVSEKVAPFLDVKLGSPVMKLRQITYLEDGRPFEFTRSQYVGSRFQFVAKVKQ
ncbi:GntR family transcriptional regulator [Listeria fleischmannii]|jgi:GntR family transcriptional regulator|uniref:GntR family transcriptional regulator n=2 Tax=Listeria fleischmannii TaxID=1069827 RepID=W7DPU6_9LIST|nr:GntR family transcriptional regulator [Listeria fleischmannii]EUJ59002.1 GntR family transcriptional regulator [Listeria fleischmannii FSL S10-1203]MBC1398861.1 GntR family transcriptional regulator [Listeria fleischmannii]MBC1427114.1 GntR family transcriptional regulator [Listeria fleischmannii]STY34092.1 HTH-type transcriptional repressor yvoA [Listeria fleischmannii subsp. coloradonensis]